MRRVQRTKTTYQVLWPRHDGVALPTAGPVATREATLSECTAHCESVRLCPTHLTKGVRRRDPTVPATPNRSPQADPLWNGVSPVRMGCLQLDDPGRPAGSAYRKPVGAGSRSASGTASVLCARLVACADSCRLGCPAWVGLNTVRTHTKSINAKLGENSRMAAVRRADELGLLSQARSR